PMVPPVESVTLNPGAAVTEPPTTIPLPVLPRVIDALSVPTSVPVTFSVPPAAGARKVKGSAKLAFPTLMTCDPAAAPMVIELKPGAQHAEAGGVKLQNPHCPASRRADVDAGTSRIGLQNQRTGSCDRPCSACEIDLVRGYGQRIRPCGQRRIECDGRGRRR